MESNKENRISIDKELTFTPIIKYGGGVDSSQRFLFDFVRKKQSSKKIM